MTKPQNAVNDVISRLVSFYQTGVLSLLHWIVETVAIWACIAHALDDSDTGWDYANSAISPLPGFCAFFLYSPGNGSPAAGGYDMWHGIGAGITVWGDAFKG